MMSQWWVLIASVRLNARNLKRRKLSVYPFATKAAKRQLIPLGNRVGCTGCGDDETIEFLEFALTLAGEHTVLFLFYLPTHERHL